MNAKRETRRDEPDWLFDSSGAPDDADRALADALGRARWEGDTDDLMRRLDHEPREGRTVAAALATPRWRLALAACAALVIGTAAWVVTARGERSEWRLESGASWRVGQWLPTAGDARVSSRLGRVTAEAGSRVRLVRAAADEHRLELAEGAIDAFIIAPPRLFFVETPAATAIDMGCAYRLEVDAAGWGLLHVTGGWVELRADPVASRVPAGAVCPINPKGGPGVPRFEDAPQALVTALDALEAGRPGALDALLDAARPRDSLTLWHLLARTEAGDRERVALALAVLAPPTDPSAVERAQSLDPAALDEWWLAIRRSW